MTKMCMSMAVSSWATLTHLANYQVQNYSYTEELMYIAYMWGTQLQHPHNVHSK